MVGDTGFSAGGGAGAGVDAGTGAGCVFGGVSFMIVTVIIQYYSAISLDYPRRSQLPLQ